MSTTVTSKSREPVNGVRELIRALTGLGISKRTVSDVLPVWWDDSIAEDPAGLVELKVILARRFSLDPKTLFGEGGQVDYLPVVRRYKGGREDLIKKLGPSTGIASSLCRSALSFVGEQHLEDLKDPVALRESILATGTANVGLVELLNVCWRARIPVLHVSLPEKMNKFDALVTSHAGRYGVALCRNEDSEAWLAFHLAHELGHIACGHLNDDGLLVDEQIKNSTATEEQEANDYATKLMGSAGIEPPQLSWKTASVAPRFVAVANDNRILPGHLVLKAAILGDFKCARALLKHIEPAPRARQLINEYSAAELAPLWNYDAEEFISQFFHKTGV